MDLEVEIKCDETELTLSSDNSPFSLSLRLDTFHSEKQLDHFIKNVERLVRNSVEYKQWVAYIIEVLGYKTCALTKEDINECDIEIHHHPVTLFTVCKAIISDFLSSGDKFCSFDVATKVIELHFQNKIGYIPLLSDLHKKYHNGFLELPIELVHGDYMHILKTFNMDDADKDKIYQLCQVKKKDCVINWQKGEYPGLSSDESESF